MRGRVYASPASGSRPGRTPRCAAMRASRCASCSTNTSGRGPQQHKQPPHRDSVVSACASARAARRGAPLDAVEGPVGSVEDVIRACEGSYTDLPEKPLWVAATALVHGVRAAGGTWAAYRRLPRKEVLRLRSLSKRGRAKATDPVLDRVFQLPNELAWCVLDFWRATSAATGEVI